MAKEATTIENAEIFETINESAIRADERRKAREAAYQARAEEREARRQKLIAEARTAFLLRTALCAAIIAIAWALRYFQMIAPDAFSWAILPAVLLFGYNLGAYIQFKGDI